MNDPFKPNSRGLAVIRLTKSYGANVAGETAGFLPAVAKELVKRGMASLPGHEPSANTAAEGDAGAELTSRKFKPQRDPLDHDGDGKKGGSVPASEREGLDKLRADYKELTDSDADQRWGQARLEAEISKALEAASNQGNGSEDLDEGQGGSEADTDTDASEQDDDTEQTDADA